MSVSVSPEKRYQCPMCHKWYRSIRTIYRHRLLMDPVHRPLTETDMSPTETLPIPVTKRVSTASNLRVQKIDFRDIIRQMDEKGVLDPEPEKTTYTCGNCKRDIGEIKLNYCKWCGAKLKQ